MEDTKNIFGKEKLVAFLSIVTMTVLCLQHFWGLFADATKIQISYVPLVVTFTTIAINEVDNSYKSRKKIIITSVIGAVSITLVGLSIVIANEYGLNIGNGGIFKKVMYLAIMLETLCLDIFEVEKLVKA